MRVVDNLLMTHLSGTSTTICFCWWITRKDGQVFGFTDHDQDLIIDGITYLAATSFDASAVETSSSFAVDNMDIQGILNSEMITEADLLAGVWDYAEVRIFLCNWNDLSQGIMKIRRGWLGEVSVDKGSFTAELRGLAQKMQQTVGEICTPTCRAELGDSRCTVDLTPFTVAGAVTAITASRRVFTDSSLSQADDYFTFGRVTWLTGNNAGLSMEVKDFTSTSDTVDLVLPMPYNIQVGDTYTIIAGCDRKRETCKNRFNNILNFRGEPDLPGLDKVILGGKNGV